MKHIILLILVVLVTTSSYAEHCSHPMNDYTFDQKIRELESIRSDRFQLRAAVRMARENCLSSLQVRTIAQSLRDDELKLRFSLRAYNKVFDPDNFYDVYDAFGSFSMAFRLHDIVHGLIPNPFGNQEDYEPYDDKPRTIKFPDLDYPKTTSYNGLTGCSNIISNQRFADLAYTLSERRSDQAKLEFMLDNSRRKCLSMAQTMKLATLFNNEMYALKMLKAYLPRIYDMENYGAARALFTSRYFKKEWMDYAKNFVSTRYPTEPVVACEPTKAQLSQIRASLKRKHFPKEKLDLARLIMKDHCFSVSQIRDMMDEFTFSSYKMEFAKMAYAHCLDQHNYYLLLDELTFPSEKRELRKYMEANQART